jgi:ribonucleoside-diphosphate reductase alpha chain
LSIQPTGNTSIFANVVSGGLEPIFMPEYIRTVIVNAMPDHIQDVTPKWYEGEWRETDMFKCVKEGDEEILKGTDSSGVVYKIDNNRGLTKEVLCQDYGVRWLADRGEWDPSADWAVTTTNLSVQDHVNDLTGFARWIDSAMSKCVAEGTLITTDKGIIPIEQLGQHDVEGFVAPTGDYKVIDEHGNLKSITSHYYGAKKPCALVRFNNGFELTMTYVHKFKTENGWKNISELCVGDKVFYRTNLLNISNEYQKIDRPHFAPNAKHISFPEVVDEDFAMLLGMWIADGSLTENSISICEKNQNVADLCEKLMLSLFGTHKSAVDGRWNVQTHFVHSRTVSRWFRENVGHGAENKQTPSFILKSPPSVQKAFIEGLTLDGYIKRDNYTSKLVVFDGYAKDVAEKLTYMLSALGIEYSLLKRSVGDNKLTYGVTAYLPDNDIIVPIEEHKQHFAVTGKTQKQTYISDEDFEKLISMQPRNTYGAMIRARLRKCKKRSNYVRMSFLDKCNFVYDDKLTCVAITDIDDVGYKKVYDIEVEDTHSYLINGIVSHNTINVPNEYPLDKFKNIYLDTYRSGSVKGVTTYRAGTMASVLSAAEEKDATSDDEEIIKDDVKLPDSAPAVLKTIRAEGRKWYLTVVYHENSPQRPFALFVKTNSHEKGVTADEAVDLLVKLAKKKRIPKRHRDAVLEKMKTDTNSSKVARLISFLLRHGVLIKNVVSALDRVENTYVGTFVFQIKKFLSTYIKDGEKVEDEKCMECGATTIVYSEGCKKCLSCGSSKCG